MRGHEMISTNVEISLQFSLADLKILLDGENRKLNGHTFRILLIFKKQQA